ncbi:bifunctional phosphopantothenoylcysteine decarboxylase/phosphopantothenate--cysteine ligase CoaBC [Fulvivirga lutimaris]|uniref:bifunctional phosphopantothenoylcysteine decarboxylase/phosphopantothenate--cysteine ligase CoaBC n=1 Tax=Fulvivirga lutimaris TaxID=1819566 RepID=UPI0012BC4489|nr:bifunctional phosphopantothenoylcysteine decarboxylase/phosphopantothenate--cysteine ligase CoaBC [Fulvivirga lutimaris]MTI41708.1 bifunctional phosphopantothenoylcysteine decarboxylase/phosphopantothenate--cysteine ligase CoaBC [Fulvivirga lutimaris]
MLRGKKIILGVCGSIAAYKSALIVRLLIKEGAEVRVIMTDAALGFITPLTLSTLSKNPVYNKFSNSDTGEWHNHVDLGLWADLILIAPASANTIAKMANGYCDNLLLATYLSAKCPVFVAPAMDLDMYAHKSTQDNLEKLISYGNTILDVASGELASGLVGAGRMQEPEELVNALEKHFSTGRLTGKKVLITAGPTYEALDPVRFIGNHSTGKMGFAIAEAMANEGAEVELVSGPTVQKKTHANINLHPVTSAEDMFLKCKEHYQNSDITVLSAAVADYRPKVKADQKIKKSGNEMALELVKTFDIAFELGKLKKNGQINIGFALETENEKVNAKKKIEAKNFDLIVLNSLNDNGAGFGHDTNKVSIIDKQNNITEFELKSKQKVASDIVNSIIDTLAK